MTDPLILGGRTFQSRLIVGTGKFSSPEVMADSLAASGAEMVTVAMRRIDLDAPADPITDFVDRDRYLKADLDAALELCEEGAVLAAVEAAIGPLE